MSQQQRTVLIVVNSPDDRELYRQYLLHDREYSYAILEATLAVQGLELWQRHQPDAVLLDYRLPDLDGLEFLAQLQPLTPQPCLPVIVVTAQGNEAIAVQAIKAGAQDYIVKEQITPERLQIAVNGIIETMRLHTQLQQRIERERVVLYITQKIHQSLNLDEILQTTVAEVREFLHTDRVLVFRLKPDGNGTILAESVGAEWRSVLSSTMYAPCPNESYIASNQPKFVRYNPTFIKNYIERYYQGQVTAVSDIHDSSIEPCHAELLAFQVRAHLVVPILQDNQFWGLLIAHHCTSPRFWQPLEIDLLKELATQMSIALRQAELYQQAQRELKERQQVEAELRQSQERLRLALLASGMGTWNWNIKTGKISWSDNLEALFGLQPGEFDGSFEMFVARLHLDDRDRVLADVDRAIATGEDYNIEFRVVYPNGTIRWALSQGKVFYDQQGQPMQMAGIDIDISERKRSAEALRDSEERFRQLAENIDAVFWIREVAENRVSYVSPAYKRLWGLNPEEMYQGQQAWVDRIHPEDRESVQRAFHEKAVAGKYDQEYRIFLPDGSIRWVHDRCFGLRDETGEIYRFAGIAEDITDRKQVEEALRQSEERYRCLAELIPQLVWTANAEGALLDVNQRWLEFTGLTLEQAHTIGWKEVVHPEDIIILAQHWSKAAQQGTSYQAEGRMRRADGVYRWHLHQAIGQKDKQGQVVKWFGSATDIEAQKQLEGERDRLFQLEQAARAEAERANRIKDEFLAVLSHELRSPLNPILGWTKLLQSRKFNETRTLEALAIIERNVKLQTQLIDDLLDIAKILRGKLSIDASPVNLASVIECAIDTVSTAAIAKSILLHPVLPNIGQVCGDSNRLQQIVWNLLSNAIKFTPKGGRVEIQLKQVNDQAQIIVSDTGKGISPDFLPYIFESFRQEDISITRKYGGLGLGLAIVRQLVEAHGGTIAADSPGVGFGATFTVHLPLLNVESEIKQIDELSQQTLELTGIRVLTVDDDPDARELLTVLLTEYGAQVLTVSSAAEVLANLESFQPDVLISDIGMPEVDGYCLMQQIRTLTPEKGGHILAIALTAYARVDDYQQAITSGYQRHLTKPFNPQELVQAVVALAHSKPSPSLK
ncbi:multi-sensor hybrid histidine kinase [Nostoc commune NIES-4072]|uniref:histidine kinase n=1 Tax=Nostoc commune NIES-4072 TaxID=2005467 RepID=A0A2R5FNP1_NOSCO|nr:PAS domain-containing protein [Nostoc commune]BBD64801.1 multi-sensor hybrid histidine kinase [Nostoc commune HK-02]GBG17873.1 multi-sensor hybrid histidine kinase [Nostoc commune NIES-4072]